MNLPTDGFVRVNVWRSCTYSNRDYLKKLRSLQTDSYFLHQPLRKCGDQDFGVPPKYV